MSLTVLLLATYNGADYLEALIESLRAQTYKDWQLWIRDDGSTDGTPAILAAAARSDARIEVVVDDHGRGGAARNFGLLMQRAYHADADYVFFVDQDDVWLPHKIERQLQEMQRVEAQYGKDVPQLVHTDLSVVDRNLGMIHPSFAEFTSVHRDREHPLCSLLVANHVTGCVSLFNRALLLVANPLPPEALMHDWWVALCGAATGRLTYIPEATILYRQHNGNVVGAMPIWRKLNPFDAGFKQRWERGVREFSKAILQMRRFRDRSAAILGEEHPAVRLAAAYCDAFEQPASVWRRWLRLRKVGYGRASVLRQAALVARLIAIRGRETDRLAA